VLGQAEKKKDPTGILTDAYSFGSKLHMSITYHFAHITHTRTRKPPENHPWELKNIKPPSLGTFGLDSSYHLSYDIRLAPSAG
jgi:hypothetical protein